MIIKNWISKFNYIPDAFILEGPLAGGHLGFKPEQIHDPKFSLEKLLYQARAALKPIEEKIKARIPLIAGGGVYDGEDICRIMKLGASGVQMGTRFVTTTECDAADSFKDLYVKSKKEDIRIINSPVGMPGRVINNQFVEGIINNDKKPFKCPYHCIVTCKGQDSPYCIALALQNAQKGYFKNGFAFAGENAYKTKEIIPVKKLIEDLKDEYKSACQY